MTISSSPVVIAEVMGLLLSSMQPRHSLTGHRHLMTWKAIVWWGKSHDYYGVERLVAVVQWCEWRCESHDYYGVEKLVQWCGVVV